VPGQHSARNVLLSGEITRAGPVRGAGHALRDNTFTAAVACGP